MKRIADFLLSFFLFILFLPLMIVISLLIKLTTGDSPLYWSKRVGKDNVIFLMPKFRSMRSNTPQLATHLLNESENYLTKIGIFLRKTSLDELPQLISILKGDMSFVGPRPALFNQDDLIELRTKCDVHLITPGLTGWAQINGRDEISIPDKVKLDEYYLQNKSFIFDIKIIYLTFFSVFFQKNISH